jgi:MYXO-CTERM domain-containing protein
MEVLTKPTDEPTRMQVCFEASPTYGCTAQSPVYTETGLYEWSTDVVDFWSPGTPDWSMGSGRIAVILKDTENGKPSIDNVGAEVAARYTPTELHLVLTWVAPGATYVPPMPTEMDGGVPPPDAGTTDAGMDDAGAADSGSTIDIGPPDAEADADAGSADSASMESDDIEGGCTAAGGSGGGEWAVLAVLVAFLRRRSRRRR